LFAKLIIIDFQSFSLLVLGGGVLKKKNSQTYWDRKTETNMYYCMCCVAPKRDDCLDFPIGGFNPLEKC